MVDEDCYRLHTPVSSTPHHHHPLSEDKADGGYASLPLPFYLKMDTKHTHAPMHTNIIVAITIQVPLIKHGGALSLLLLVFQIALMQMGEPSGLVRKSMMHHKHSNAFSHWQL